MAATRSVPRRRFLGLALATPALLAACGGASASPTAAPPKAAEPTKPAAAPAATTAPAATQPAATTAPAAAPTPTTAPAAASKPAAAGPAELVFSNWNDDTYGRFREEEKVKLFNEKFPDIKINMRLFRQNYHETLITQLAGGVGADVFRIDIPYIYPFADQGTIPDLTSRVRDKDFWYSSPDARKEMFDALLYRGKLYALATGLDSNALEVNLNLFEQGQVARPPQSYADGKWNTDLVLEAAKQLTKREGGTPTQYGISASMDAWNLAPLVRSFGGRTLSDDLTTLLWHEEPAVKAIQYMADLVAVHKVAPSPTGGSTGEAQTFGYATGKLAMYWSYPSQLAYRYNAKLPWDWSLAPQPPAPGQPARTALAYNAWTMNAKSKSPDAAWAFLGFLAGPVATRVDVELGWAAPLFKSLDSAYYQRILKEHPGKNVKPGVEASQYVQGWYDPHMQPGWAQAEQKFIKPALDEVILGRKTAADAVKEFKPDVDKLLQEGAAKLKG